MTCWQVLYWANLTGQYNIVSNQCSRGWWWQGRENMGTVCQLNLGHLTFLPWAYGLYSAKVGDVLYTGVIWYLQQLPVVPLFGDVQIALSTYVKMCPSFESMRDKWTCAAENASDKMASQYNIVSRMDGIREEHVKYISELARYNNGVRQHQRSSNKEDTTVNTKYID